jgi:hypothetical protein
MSFPAKENLIFFEELAKRQTQLFPDACDYGIEIQYSKTKAEARENLMALMKIYKYKLTRPENARYPYDVDFKNCSDTELFIPFEKDEGRYVGVKLIVSFETYTNNQLFGKKYTEILTINIIHHTQENSGYQPIKEKSTADKWAENARDARRFA